MGDVTMCHHHEYGTESWWSDEAENEEEIDAEDDDWMPEGFEEERNVDVELITDGGDE